MQGVHLDKTEWLFAVPPPEGVGTHKSCRSKLWNVIFSEEKWTYHIIVGKSLSLLCISLLLDYHECLHEWFEGFITP